jgi:hypothetical protein
VATSTIVWIVVAVVALLIITAPAMMARKRCNQQPHLEAQEFREEAREQHQRVQTAIWWHTDDRR